MTADQLYHDPALAQFYDAENEWTEGLEYCRQLAASCASVLDLGCGTGLFAATLAQEGRCAVTGADPAAAMLDIARARSGGHLVRWLQADARALRLNERFDLIVLTGHAFQVFLTREDQAAVLRTIASHLRPNGRFIFDSRNPLVEEWKEWTPEQSQRTLTHPLLGAIEAWNDVSRDAASGVVSYDSYYRVQASGRLYSACSPIAFPAQERLAELLEEAGLIATSWLGGWDQRPCTADAPEIIVAGTLQGALTPAASTEG
ncbi:bifunctional 2-polyprenyl-6-hydroxyphenol methylase/3-demethylubiquinol 3-O-methyltransferase UbiG [Massilia sp. BJB1822]|uniref:class I SAM-dependent methyltransferase n=1 Tax=Massilia sp. BJB1822 TaxID=2744470 RepID=UPI0015936B7E|nr:class I SAM-dependent methyltransferase [Massilia sp. BJB1822]NVD99618.1 class I SAM-dependent methyltransferase [Massilia sp. BJB1822]